MDDMPAHRRDYAPMSKEELTEAAYEMTGGNLADLPIERLYRLMTVTQYVTDLCLNEVERRGLLEKHEDTYCVPYMSDHGVETCLTRGCGYADPVQ